MNEKLKRRKRERKMFLNSHLELNYCVYCWWYEWMLFCVCRCILAMLLFSSRYCYSLFKILVVPCLKTHQITFSNTQRREYNIFFTFIPISLSLCTTLLLLLLFFFYSCVLVLVLFVSRIYGCGCAWRQVWIPKENNITHTWIEMNMNECIDKDAQCNYALSLASLRALKYSIHQQWHRHHLTAIRIVICCVLTACLSSSSHIQIYIRPTDQRHQ